MSDIPPPSPAAPQPPSGGISLQNLLHVTYGLFALGFITGGFGAIAAVVLAYIKRVDAVGTLYASHFDWILRTFWWGLLWVVVSIIFMMILIGWVGLFVTLIWVLYRVVKGWLALAENRPVGDAY